jgi:hypothetical protein
MNDHEKMLMIKTPGSLHHGKDRSRLERNLDMVKMKQQGKTLSEIALKYGLSRCRVSQIICQAARHAIHRNKALFEGGPRPYGYSIRIKEALEIFERIGI